MTMRGSILLLLACVGTAARADGDVLSRLGWQEREGVAQHQARQPEAARTSLTRALAIRPDWMEARQFAESWEQD